jgi:hypothetical protein
LRRRVFEPLVAGVIHFPPKVDCFRGFTERVERHEILKRVAKVFVYRRLYGCPRYVECEGGDELRREGWKKMKTKIQSRPKLWGSNDDSAALR